MLQHDHLFEWRSILKNVLLGAEINKSVSQETKQRAKELLRQYGLKRFINSRPSELSGGMRQRAALIRTLMPNPELLLLDEPFSALDYQTRLTVSDDIGKIIKHSGKTALLVTHDLSEAISLADRIIILTKRPAHIARIVPIAFSIENDTPLNRRNAPEFKQYFNEIWKELNQDEHTFRQQPHERQFRLFPSVRRGFLPGSSALCSRHKLPVRPQTHEHRTPVLLSHL